MIFVCLPRFVSKGNNMNEDELRNEILEIVSRHTTSFQVEMYGGSADVIDELVDLFLTFKDKM